MITGAMIDTREPDWVQHLTFGGVPTMPIALDAGDVWVTTDDNFVLQIERKTPNDFLNSLKDDRLFPQLERLAEKRVHDLLTNLHSLYWPYLVITGEFKIGQGNKVYTDRQTGWPWASVQGALLSIQEMGIGIVYAAGDTDFEDCIIRLSERRRDREFLILPPRPGRTLGVQASIIAALPGIGIDRTIDIMQWSNGKVAEALVGLTDLDIDAPEGIGKKIKARIRNVLGLQDDQELTIWTKESESK